MPDDHDDPRLTTIITTEHFTLQTARAAAISQSSARANTYLGAVSSALIALAFIRDLAGAGAGFHVFALSVLTPLSFLGLATFERTLQLAAEDVVYAWRINALRRYYFRAQPSAGEYLLSPVDADDIGAVMGQGGLVHSHGKLQLFLTTAGMVALINSFLSGILVGLALDAVGAERLVAVAAGSVVFVGAAALQFRHIHGALSKVRTPEVT